MSLKAWAMYISLRELSFFLEYGACELKIVPARIGHRGFSTHHIDNLSAVQSREYQ